MNVVTFKPAPQDAFQEFWDAYPKRVGKGYARKAFAAACKIATSAEIIAGAMRYADHVKQEGTQIKYVPHPATWLNGERWDDEYPEWEGDFSDF